MISAFILLLLQGGRLAASQFLNPDFSTYDLFAYCTSNGWVDLNNSTYNVSGPAYLFVNRTLAASAARFRLEIDPGFPSNDTFSVHVHSQVCSNSNGGDHWLYNPNDLNATDYNNSYLAQFDGTGDGTTLQTTWWLDNDDPNVLLDTRAVSLVLHASDDSELACCNLNFVRKYAVCSGAFTPLDVYTGTGYASVYVDLSSEHTVGILNWTITPGFADDEVFQAHVHNESCSAADGGPHWYINSSYTGAINAQNNFIWQFEGMGNGSGVQTQWEMITDDEYFAVNDFIKSVVIHNASDTRILCCDLVFEDTAANFTADLDTTGYDMIAYCPMENFVMLDSNFTVCGSAFLYANNALESSLGVLNFTVEPAVSANSAFFAYVQNSSCAAAGGGLWMQNPALSNDTMANEFWFELAGTGDAATNQSDWSIKTVKSGVVLNKLAASIVIYATDDQLACCDLKYVTKFASCPAASDFVQLNAAAGAVTGSADIYMSDDNSSTVGDLKFVLTPGIGDNSMFAATVHMDTCANGAGDQWEANINSTDTSTNNTFSWFFCGNGDGTITQSEWSLQTNDEMFAPDCFMQSVVIHAPDMSALACCDLTIQSAVTSTGSPTAAGTGTTTASPTAAGTGTTSSPTASPTAAGTGSGTGTTSSPSASPTTASTLSPTSFPTASPVATQTGAPTKAKTAAAAQSSSLTIYQKGGIAVGVIVGVGLLGASVYVFFFERKIRGEDYRTLDEVKRH